jgi:hypothetical protein
MPIRRERRRGSFLIMSTWPTKRSRKLPLSSNLRFQQNAPRLVPRYALPVVRRLIRRRAQSWRNSSNEMTSRRASSVQTRYQLTGVSPRSERCRCSLHLLPWPPEFSCGPIFCTPPQKTIPRRFNRRLLVGQRRSCPYGRGRAGRYNNQFAKGGSRFLRKEGDLSARATEGRRT